MKAFPCRSVELEENRAGMDLRDYFAAKAMQGIMAGAIASNQGVDWKQVARSAYYQAEAMMHQMRIYKDMVEKE
jgi:hypothetical protein